MLSHIVITSCVITRFCHEDLIDLHDGDGDGSVRRVVHHTALIEVLLLEKLLKVTEDNLDGATYNFVVHSFVIGVTVTFMNIFHTL